MSLPWTSQVLRGSTRPLDEAFRDSDEAPLEGEETGIEGRETVEGWDDSKTAVVVFLVDLEADREVRETCGDTGVKVLRSRTGAVAGNKLFTITVVLSSLLTGEEEDVSRLVATAGRAEMVDENLIKGCNFHPVWV